MTDFDRFEDDDYQLHQLIEEHRDLLEFLYADNGSWEAVGRLLGYVVTEAENSRRQ
ncbi:hypothetical protein ACFFUA_37575 [Streptomyces heliomycini]|uniref:Uncharacterized protein n=1 Tax=Streptomyces heliomycini TaxID=284032 RepID=A0ABV5LMB1_9ACTN